MRNARLIAPVLLAVACQAPFSAVDESLRESNIRTVAVDDRFTLYTPYDLARSLDLRDMVEENLVAVCGTLEVTLEEPIQVHAHGLEMQGFAVRFDGDQIHYEGTPHAPTLHDVAGYATRYEEGEAPAVVFFVAAEETLTAPDGQSVKQHFRFNYAGIVRHELAHLCASLNLPDGPTWFDEGLALELEYSRPEGDRLVPGETPLTLQLARKVHREYRLTAILDWREDGAAITRGDVEPFQEGRPLAHSYMRFLLERRGGDRSSTAFGRILAMTREEHLALEEEWHRWLEIES